MSQQTTQQLLEKYHDIIAEEVNVKEVGILPEAIEITMTYVPLGQKLSGKFGKETGLIIGAAKEGNVELLGQGKIKVFIGENERVLERDEYEVRYHGLDEATQTVEENAVISLDLTITDELKAEGTAREISRFLNQLRKDAGYQVDDRVVCYRQSDSELLLSILQKFEQFLMQEALLSEIKHASSSGEITKTFEYEEEQITFSLKK